MDVETKERPELRVATVRHVGPYNQISEAFERLGTVAGRAGLFTGPPTMLAIYHDDPESTPEEQLLDTLLADLATWPPARTVIASPP